VNWSTSRLRAQSRIALLPLLLLALLLCVGAGAGPIAPPDADALRILVTFRSDGELLRDLPSFNCNPLLTRDGGPGRGRQVLEPQPAAVWDRANGVLMLKIPREALAEGACNLELEVYPRVGWKYRGNYSQAITLADFEDGRLVVILELQAVVDRTLAVRVVRGPASRPVAGEVLVLRERSERVTRHATTDEQGIATFTIELGRDYVISSGGRLPGSAYAMRDSPLLAEQISSLSTPLTIVAPTPALTVEIRDRDNPAQPMTNPGDYLDLLRKAPEPAGPAASGNTRVSGRFEAGSFAFRPLDAGDYRVAWDRNDVLNQYIVVEGEHVKVTGTPASPQHHVVVVARRQEKVPLTVRLTEADSGKALADATVVVLEGNATVAQARTDALGLVRFDPLRVGDYTVKTTLRGYQDGSELLRLRRVTELPLVLVPQRTYRIDIISSPNAPVLAVREVVVVQMDAGELRERGGTRESDKVWNIRGLSEGYAHFAAIADVPGAAGEVPRYIAGSASAFVRADGALTINVQPPVAVSGTIAWQTPVPNSPQVYFIRNSDRTLAGRARIVDGTYSIHLAPGVYRLYLGVGGQRQALHYVSDAKAAPEGPVVWKHTITSATLATPATPLASVLGLAPPSTMPTEPLP
jgi:hypothetical protein